MQGVGFRYATQAQARRLGVNGWVRNRSDGSVEALAHGPQDAVDAFVEWARRGPASAKVSSVDVSPASGTFVEFETRPTA